MEGITFRKLNFKGSTILSFLFFVSCLLFAGCTKIDHDLELTIVAPAGEEKLLVGDVITIKWETSISEPVDLYYQIFPHTDGTLIKKNIDPFQREIQWTVISSNGKFVSFVFFRGDDAIRDGFTQLSRTETFLISLN